VSEGLAYGREDGVVGSAKEVVVVATGADAVFWFSSFC